MSFLLPICLQCKHYHDGERACAAFPEGIPDAIWEGRSDHIEPYSGDHGIQFEPRN